MDDNQLGWAQLCVLNNNKVIIGTGNQNQGALIIYNDNGKQVHIIDDLAYSPKEIMATSDQGFIVKSIREIKGLPQPIYISSIWMDLEVAIMKYDSNYELEWRKIYDNYPDEMRLDFVLPLEN